jgi:hypothetical protein
MKKDFFPEKPDNNPKIYAYTEISSEYSELLKIGYTARSLDERMREHYPTKGPREIKRYKVLLLESSMRNDGTFFIDKDVHKILYNNGFKNVGGEWFKCDVNDVKAAIVSLKENTKFDSTRSQSFSLRPEQKDAIDKTYDYFKNYKLSENKIPHFLWNCKMRFGKTFASYKLAQKMKWKKILILTFKPAVENSWKEDLLSHVDFKDWQFISKDTNSYNDLDKSKPFVCFASFQDFLGKTITGGIKIKNKWAHKIVWDCIILDEYHYGAWRDTAKELYEFEDKKEQSLAVGEGIDSWDENISPLKTNNYLYLSGTPFRAIESGEFIEEQIFNWTYSDEQNAKLNWKGENNPYESLPRMVMMTYQLPEQITQITSTGEYDEFDLNVFFKAKGELENSEFLFKNEIQKWLDLIRGTGFENIYDGLRLGISKPVLPFADVRLLNVLSHTFWFLPSVSSCYAMKNLLMERQNIFFQEYDIIVCAGAAAGIGVKSLKPVLDKMNNPLKSKSITLSCGKLTTGVTVKPWAGIFMLRNTTSPETYFQSAFRVQSPWTIKIEGKKNILEELLIKKECYVFDFAPNRALRLITDYSCRLDINETNPEKKIDEFIKFLPVLCFDGSSMRQINASEVLDYGMLGTSGSQLARKFESTRLVNVDDMTLKRLLNSPELLDALMSIEGFRNLNTDLEKIINKSENINKIKKEGEKVSQKDKEKLSDEEKEIKGKRKLFQEKLKKLSTRIPVFMYLTDYREETLKDIITKIEPGLFTKVTGITIEIFEKMISIGLFNSTLMNSAVFAFKRYENSSLAYAGGFTKFKPNQIGLFDTKISREEFANFN